MNSEEYKFLEEMCKACINPMKTSKGCDGNCAFTKEDRDKYLGGKK